MFIRAGLFSLSVLTLISLSACGGSSTKGQISGTGEAFTSMPDETSPNYQYVACAGDCVDDSHTGCKTSCTNGCTTDVHWSPDREGICNSLQRSDLNRHCSSGARQGIFQKFGCAGNYVNS